VFDVVVAAGSLRLDSAGAWRLPHRWTDEGVTVSAEFTGAHLLHVAAAGCVLNDLYRESGTLGVVLEGVRVTASGGFDESWVSTGISYSVELDSPASPEALAGLLAAVDEVAEIPRALRAGAPVTRGA
jgi:hypothetical protein